jgi:formylglycine-generating enzyme required for sulfatase activity
MNTRNLLSLLLVALPLASPAGGNAAAQLPRGMVRIEAGSFSPLYAQHGNATVHVQRFAIDTVPVSLASFRQFVQRHPEWARGRVPGDRADAGYLKHVDANSGAPGRAATHVSWFAAAAYCRARGARLPTTDEWEYLARASEKDRNAAAGAGFKQRVLELALAAQPGTFLIGSGLRNVWGVRDLHGGLMEWTQDFQAAAGNGASSHRHDASTCAGGTSQTGDASDYAAFLRYAYRAALAPQTTAAHLGFRCAAPWP